MKTAPVNSLAITESQEGAGLSDAQQAFKQLVNTIEQQRALLAAWQQMVEQYQQKYHGEFEPLLSQLNQQQTQLVQLFNQAYDNKQFGANDKKKLSRLIVALAADLLPSSDSAEIAQIVRMHSQADQPELPPPEDPLSARPAEEATTTLEPWEQAAQLRLQQKQQRQANRKSCKLMAQEVRQQELVQDASRSLRAVYRQLASALHPDREQDERERQRKTSLMQRVNVAYGKQDLLQLLTLQLELEQIDHTQIEAQNTLQLQHYHLILTGQLAELRQEIQDIQNSFGVRAPARRHAAPTPDSVLRRLQRHIQQLRVDIQQLDYRLASFKHLENIIAWVKNQL